MASDDLRARITEALCPPHHRVGSFSSGGPVTALSPCRLHQAQADTVMAVVQPELDELRGKVTALEACYEVVAADALAHGLCSLKRHSLLQRAERAEAALQAVREAQSLGEALAAVAKHDGLTRDLIEEPVADPQPVSAEFFTELEKTTARETDDLHGWYAAMDDQPTTEEETPS